MKDYMKQALRTENTDYESIKERVQSTTNIRLLHGAMLLSTEANEFMDMLKKHIFYGKRFDIANAVEELGDMFWGIALILDELGVPVEEVLGVNINKLKLRYPNKFTEELAVNRDLEKEKEFLDSKFNTDTHIKILG
jgi:NTP pyrophosphatase (non-canonical NTP hydrolase)